MTDYKPGDIANGHRLTESGEWVPVDSPPPPPPAAGRGDHKAQAKADKAYAKANRPWFKKKRFIIPLALVALMVIAGVASGGGTSTAPPDNSAAQEGSSGSMGEEAPAEESGPEMTPGQKNALRAAENYLSFTPFSRDGLIQQLSSDAGDGYSVEDATFAADHVDVVWKEQAVKAAKNYLEMTAFSRDGLIQQLSSDAGDKYTVEEATYGADKALAEQE